MQTLPGRAASRACHFAVIGAFCAGLLGCQDRREAVAPKPRAQVDDALRTGSTSLLAPHLDGVSLGMTTTELLRSHPRLKRQPTADRDGLTVFEEVLVDGAHALYFFDASEPTSLRRVQLASELPNLEAVVKRVLDRQQRLGAPSGVWDCPAAGGALPSRRYSFRMGSAAAADVFVLLGEHALATYYVANRADIQSSLGMAGCEPVPPERATRFPAVPTPTQ